MPFSDCRTAVSRLFPGCSAVFALACGCMLAPQFNSSCPDSPSCCKPAASNADVVFCPASSCPADSGGTAALSPSGCTKITSSPSDSFVAAVVRLDTSNSRPATCFIMPDAVPNSIRRSRMLPSGVRQTQVSWLLSKLLTFSIGWPLSRNFP